MDFETVQNQEFISVTQCPYCETAFHIGLSQLDAADGRVRCGGCLRVFNAKEHFLVEQRRLFDDKPDSEEIGVDREEKLEVEEIEIPVADPFGGEIIEDDGPVILGNFNHAGSQSIPRDAILKDEVDHFRQEDYLPASANDVLGEDEEQPEPENVFEGDELSETIFSESEVESESESELAQTISDLQEIVTVAEEPIAGLPVIDSKAPSNNSLDGIEREISGENEIESTNQPHSSDFFIEQPNIKEPISGSDKLVWLVALAIIILIIPIQLIYRQPAGLVEKAWFRNIGHVVCPAIGCEIPVYANLDAVRISGFIEPHNQYKNSLVAKVDLRNTAISEQPFPNIAIFFRNMSGKVTASREFSPDNYLRGEARAYKVMPRDRNFQLELEFVDPGEQSTSYEMFVQGSYQSSN